MKDFMIRGDIAHCPSPNELAVVKDGLITVKDGCVSSIGRGEDGLPVVDTNGALIIPGLCDMHVHAPQYAMRGLGMDLELLPWLNAYTFPEESKFADPVYAREVYGRFVRDLVLKGTTRASVFASLHYNSTFILMDLIEEAGIDAFVGKVNMDRNSPDELREDTQASMDDTLRWLNEWSERGYKHVRPIITPRFIPSCTDELSAFLGKLAIKRGLCVQSHLNENIGEIEWVRSLVPDCANYSLAYDKFGLFGDTPTLMAHCVHMSEDELGLMARKGVVAVHCPDSNANLSSGMARVRTLLDHGVSVALGSDLAGGCSVSILDAMAKAIRISKLVWAEHKEQKFLSTAEALYLGTSAGAAFFGCKPGFAVGSPFHAVVIDDSALVNTARLSVEERVERMINLYEDRHITAVYANGRKIYGA